MIAGKRLIAHGYLVTPPLLRTLRATRKRSSNEPTHIVPANRPQRASLWRLTVLYDAIRAPSLGRRIRQDSRTHYEHTRGVEEARRDGFV